MMSEFKIEEKERDLFISDDITSESAFKIIEKITEINRDDKKKGDMYKEYKPSPIKIHMMSYGGCVYSGFALYDAINSSTTPVWVICYGAVMSMGLPILLSASKRILRPHTTVMYHESGSIEMGKLSVLKMNIDEIQRLQNMIDSIIINKTLITREKLESVKKEKIDWYMDALEAKKLGICDEIL